MSLNDGLTICEICAIEKGVKGSDLTAMRAAIARGDGVEAREISKRGIVFASEYKEHLQECHADFSARYPGLAT